MQPDNKTMLKKINISFSSCSLSENSNPGFLLTFQVESQLTNELINYPTQGF